MTAVQVMPLTITVSDDDPIDADIYYVFYPGCRELDARSWRAPEPAVPPELEVVDVLWEGSSILKYMTSQEIDRVCEEVLEILIWDKHE